MPIKIGDKFKINPAYNLEIGMPDFATGEMTVVEVVQNGEWFTLETKDDWGWSNGTKLSVYGTRKYWNLNLKEISFLEPIARTNPLQKLFQDTGRKFL